MKYQLGKLILNALISTMTVAFSLNAGANLVSSSTRPTVAEFLNFHGALPAQNPYPRQEYTQFYRGNYGHQMGETKARLANVIAQLEKAFPGARYVGMGRDCQFMADAMDSFYSSIGQSDRVLRLNASGNSFIGADPATILKFLESNGLDLRELHRNPNAPGFILFDGTRFNPGSQSRLLLSAIYAEASRLGMDLSALSRRVNVVSMAFDGYQYYPQNRIQDLDPDAFFRKIAPRIGANGPSEILSIDAWNITHGWEWHDTFSQFQADGRGRVVTRPGALMPIANRQAALGDMYEIIKLTQSSAFLASVKRESKALGFEFSENLAKKEPAKKDEVKKEDDQKDAGQKANGKAAIEQELEQRLNSLRRLRAAPEAEYVKKGDLKLTANGWKMYDWYHEAIEFGSAGPALILLSMEAQNKNVIGDRDARRLIRIALEGKLTANDIRNLKTFFGEDSERSDYLALKVLNSKDGVSAQVQAIGEKILGDKKVSCQKAVKGK